MREIKFRAWHKRNKEFYNWGIGNIDDNGGLGTFPSDLIYLEHNQYTGLKDKNGIEIYEGDIIQDCESNTGEVSYIQDHCQFLINMGEGIDLQEIGDWCEVIGNIYENSELLNEPN